MVVDQVLPCSVWQRLVAAQSQPELTAGPEDRKHRAGDEGCLCVSLQIGHGHVFLASTVNLQLPWFGAGEKGNFSEKSCDLSGCDPNWDKMFCRKPVEGNEK